MPDIINKNQIDYLRSLRNLPDQLIKEMEEFAAEKKIPILDWKSAELLEQIVLMYRPKRVLEIGTAIAYSSIRIAKQLREKAILDTLEKSKNNIKLAKEYIKKAGLESCINMVEGDALLILPKLDKKYDLIFLDADKQDYERLFFYSLMLLKKGGVLFVDNLLWHGYAATRTVPISYKNSTKIIRDFNKMFVSQTSLITSILPIGDGIGIGVKV